MFSILIFNIMRAPRETGLENDDLNNPSQIYRIIPVTRGYVATCIE